MILKSTMLSAPAIMAPRAAAFVLVLLLTRRLGPAEFGLYALVLLIGEMLDMGASNWIRFALLRSDVTTPAAWRDALAKSGRLAAGFLTVAALIGVGVAMVMVPQRAAAFATAVAAYMFSSSAVRLGLTSLQLQHRRIEYAVLECTRAFGLLCSGWIASAIWPNFLAVCLANALVTGSCAVAVMILSVRKMPPGGVVSASYMSRIRYGMPIVALTFVSYLVASSDRVFLKLFSGAASVGIYAAAYSIARTPADVIGNSVNQGGFPELMRRHDEKGVEAAAQMVRNAFELMTVLQFTVLGFSAGLAVAIANALLPTAFRETAVYLLPIISAGGACISLKVYVFDNIFHATKTNWLQFMTYAPVGLLTVAASVLFIPKYGALGAALAFLIGSFGGLVSSILLSRRFIKVRLSAVEFGKAVFIGAVGGVGGRLVWMALPNGLPHLVSLMIAGGVGGALWALAIVLVRPRTFAGAMDKAWKFGVAKLGIP